MYECETILCVDNETRMNINSKMNLKFAHENALLLKGVKEIPHSQDMRIWPGLVLQARITRGTLRNALRYRVLNADTSKCKFRQINDKSEEVGEEFEWPTNDLTRAMKLSYAMTYDSSQSRTLYGKVRLTQTDHPCFTLRKLIVGLGRAPEGSQLEVE